MPDYIIQMLFDGTVNYSEIIKPTEDYPRPWDNWAITNRMYGPLMNMEKEEVGIMIIRRAKDMDTALKEADDARIQAIGETV